MLKIEEVDIDIERKAIRFRIDNGFGNIEPIRLKSLLLKCNVLTLFKPLTDNFSGMAVRINEDRFMLVNCEHSLGKQHFTIAHELYHLFIQKDFLSKQCITGKFNKEDVEEYKADLFAAYLLLPEEALKLAIPPGQYSKNKISLETILNIEQYFSVSRRALLQRLKKLGLIDAALFDKYIESIKRSASAYGYGLELYNSGNRGLVVGDYGVTANQLFRQQRISESYYLQLMRSIGIDPLEEQTLDLDNE